MSKTPGLSTTFFCECQHLPTKITTFFHEFQHLPTKITTFFTNLITSYPKSTILLPSFMRLYTYILIRTFSKELSSEAINSFFFSGYYEKWLFRCNLHAFWKPPPKTPRKTNIFRWPCPKHLVFRVPFFCKFQHLPTEITTFFLWISTPPS